MLHNDRSAQLELSSTNQIQQTDYEPITTSFLPSPLLVRLPHRPEGDQGFASLRGFISDSWYFGQSQAVPIERMYSIQESTQETRAASDFDTVRVSIPRPIMSSEVQRLILRNPIRRHLFFALKMLFITLCFLVDLPIVFVLLTHNPTYQIVNLVIVLVLYSNVTGLTIQRHYHITVDTLKTTLHLNSIKIAENLALKVHPSKYEQLKSIHDTTAYLKALKSFFLEKK
jgi:hypothetical protein